MLVRVRRLIDHLRYSSSHARTDKRKVWSQAVAPLTLVGRVRNVRVRLLRQFTVLGLKFGTQDFTDPGLIKIRWTLTGLSLWVLPSQVFLRLLRYSCATLNWFWEKKKKLFCSQGSLINYTPITTCNVWAFNDAPTPFRRGGGVCTTAILRLSH